MINKIIKDSRNIKLSACSSLEIFGQHELIQVPQE
jgi:hypothetical protein